MVIKGSYDPPFFPFKTYEELEKGVKENPKLFKHKDELDKATSSLKLSDIRPTFKDDGLKKCKCSADLSMEGIRKKVTVEYTAQFTSDGLLVEVNPVSWLSLFTAGSVSGPEGHNKGPATRPGPGAAAAPEAQN